MLDTFYISFLNIFKKKLGKKVIPLALYYVSFCEIILYSLLLIFFSAFASQLNMIRISPQKVITLTILGVLFIFFKNWMRYNGKRRHVLNAKSQRHKLQTWKLIVLPLACIVLSVIIFQAI